MGYVSLLQMQIKRCKIYKIIKCKSPNCSMSISWFYLVKKCSNKSILYKINATLLFICPICNNRPFKPGYYIQFIARPGTTEPTNQALIKSAMRGTAILITVSVTFILLTGPNETFYFITTNPHPIATVVTYNLN